MDQQVLIKRIATIELARLSFWRFCKALAPDFYTEEREHLKILCDTLQKLYDGNLIAPNGIPTRKLMINMPPQHGKSRTLFLFCQWILGRNVREKIITASYNDTTASDFSRYTRDGIIQERRFDYEVVYSDIFPETRLKKGNSAFEKWALDGQHFSYLGAGIGGSITGKGGTVLIVDDPIKSAKEALSDRTLEDIWTWYTSTFLSRVSAQDGEPFEIINMTRWSVNDLCGKLLENEGQRDKWFILKMEAYNRDTDQMLCPSFLSKERYLDLKSLAEESIFMANYHQEPFEAKGLLFSPSELKYYKPSEIESKSFSGGISYIDVADEGNDYTVMPIGKNINALIYIPDVVCSNANSDTTIPLCNDAIRRNGVKYTRVETNSMGGMFLKELRRVLPKDVTAVGSTSSENKHTRIIMAAGFIKKYCRFLEPEFQNQEYRLFMKFLTSYKKDGGAKVDDPADALSGLMTFIQSMLPEFYDR